MIDISCFFTFDQLNGGYTKHYFIGNEHIATTFGNGGLEGYSEYRTQARNSPRIATNVLVLQYAMG